MKGLILDRKKYIIERSEYYSNTRRMYSFVGAILIIAVITILSLVNIGKTNSKVDNTDKNINDVSVQLIEGEERKNSDISKVQSESKDEQINSEQKRTGVAIIKKDIPENYYVTKVVDGDTIYVSGIKTRIRLIGINTPETVSSSEPIQCYGPEASNYLTNLILGKNVGLESDVNSGDVDKYGRPLRYVYFNGENVNQRILLEGYGKEANYGSEYKYRSQFMEAEKDARIKNKGLWSPRTCDGQV